MTGALTRYLLLVVLVVTLSCSDDDNKASRTDFLTAHAWVVTQYEIDGQVEDVMECSADDVFTFSKDGKYSSTVGSVKCDDEEDVSGTWFLKDNDQVLSITLDGVANDATIVILTPTNLKLKSKIVLTVDGEIVAEQDMYTMFSAK